MSEVWWKAKQLAVRDRTGQVATKICAKLKLVHAAREKYTSKEIFIC